MIAPAVHLEILPAEQRAVLERVGPIASELGFYLAGGTAVALRLGHRLSVDLDWFTGADELEPHALAAELKARLTGFDAEEIGERALHAILDGVRLTFLRYRYPLLAPLEDAGSFRLAALKDLVCMKLAAATQRGEKKDFYDIAAICDKEIELTEALALYRRKFGLSGSGHALMALTYFDDAELGPDPVALDGITWAEVKRRLVARAKEISRPQPSRP